MRNDTPPAAAAGTLDSDIVFVFGALRSGTTLFRLMLDEHPQLANPGEVDFLFDHLRRDPSRPRGWRYNRIALANDRVFRERGLQVPGDKDGLDLLEDLLAQLSAGTEGRIVTLNLHRHLTRLREVMPRARLLHLLRDPRDVAKSSIGMGWAGTVYHGVDHWIATEEEWDSAAPGLVPGQALMLRYEDLFADLEVALAEVCAFLGVPYDPAMREYYRQSSYAPPDSRLVAQWKRRLTPRQIALVEGKAGRLMEARGYSRTGPGHVPNRLGRLGLTVANKAGRWQFVVRRFGVGNVLAERLTRRFMRKTNRRIQLRMQEITRQNLK